MEIAYASHDITPPPGEEMAGYGFYINRRAEGTLDPLCARVCAFREKKQTAVLVQLDLIGLGADHAAELRDRLGRAHGIGPEAFMFHCTHTHTGPSSMSFFGVGHLTEALRGILTKQICDAVADALKLWQPVAGVKWFDESFEGIGFNRDKPGGPVDSQVRGVIIGPGNMAPVVLVNYACHPVTLGPKRKYSADYPGAVATCLAASGCRCVFLNGPCGDIDPLVNRVQWGSGTPETVRLYGKAIADVVAGGFEGAQKVSLSPIHVAWRKVDLAVAPAAQNEIETTIMESRRALAKDPTDGLARAKLNAALWLRRRLSSGRPNAVQPVEVQVFRLGDVTIAGVGAELFTALGQSIRRVSGVKRLLLAATSNGVVGYLATKDSIQRQSYAAQSAFFYGNFPQEPGSGEQFARDVGLFVAQTGRSPR